MFGGAEEEDADFLSPTGGTRLASLFGLDQTVTETGNDFFQYTPPKQPKKGQTANAASTPSQKPPVPASGVPSVFIATAVHAYRFVNGQYVKQGKYGAAVVGSHVTKEYRILLYINQQQQIAAARIHWGFVFTVQPNNYSTFYDDQRQNWSIMFESEKAAMDFSKQLCVAKYNSNPSLDAVLYQDLTIGEGQGVEVGDALEVAFTGWLFQNGGLGQVFDSNVNKDKLLRLKLGSGKVIKGWEEGMIGLKKGARRFLIVPPALAYGSQGIANRIPPDSTLAFEVEVKRVRLVKDSATNGQSLGPRDSLAPSPAPTPENLAVDPSGLVSSAQPPKLGEPAVRVKSNSISEQLANPDLAKAKLISRMAKMGQPMLPFLSTTSASQLDSSDSEIEDPSVLRGAAQPPATPPLKPPPQTTLPQMTGQAPQPAISGLQGPSAAIIPAVLQPHATLPGTSQSFQPFPGVTYAYPQASAATSQLQPVGAVYPAPFQAAGDIGSFLMTEARQQNTEIRLAVGKVADKMDQLVAKVEELQKQNSSHSLLPGISSVTMETSMIMSNIQRIIQENERLKQEVFEKSSRIEELNEKISELIDRNQRYVEQSNLLMERRNNSLQMTTEHTQARVLHAEQEKVKVAEELAAATAQISRLQLELTDHQKKEMELRSQLNVAVKEAERHGGELSQLQAQLAELQESSEDVRNKFQLEKQSRKQLDGKVSVLEEELADLRTEKENLEKSLSDRKKKSLLERKQAEDEMEEIRRSYQEELDKLRQLLKKARTSTDQAASEQLSLMQAELESQWEAKSERLLASAKEQHARQYQDICEQRDAQQQQISQLEEKLSLLKNAKSSEDERVSTLQEQLEQLEPVKEKYLALQSQMAVLKAQHEEQIQELKKVVDRPSPARAPEEVKKIMNGVFQALRGQFDLEEFYTGRIVLGIVMNTIKTTTLQLLEQQKEKEERVETEEEDLAATEGSQTSPETHSLEHRTDSAPPEPLPSASIAAAAIPSTNLEKESSDSPPASGEGDQAPVDSAASEALILKACDDQIPSTLNQSAESLQGPKIAQLSAREEEEESNAQGGTRPVGAAASGLEPAADEASLKVQEAQIEAVKEDKPGPDLPSQHSSDFTPPASAIDKQDVDGGQQEPTPTQDCSSLEDEDELFKAATLKPSTPRGQVEEEEEEELSFKGRPPPTPLFGDDDDDDDLNWLS